jgi:hypothetical protein
VPDGLIVQTPGGPAIWNAATGTVGPALGPGRLTASVTSNGETLAWCNNTCADVHTVPLAAPGPATAPHAGMQQLALSNDNHRLAYLRPTGGDRSALVVRELATGSETPIATGLAQYGSIAWSADSSQLFYSENSYGKGSMHLGRYTTSNRHWEYRNIDVGDAVSGLVILPPAQAHQFFTDHLTSPATCPGAGMVYPSGRHGICSFRF